MTASCSKTGISCLVVGALIAAVGFISMPVFQWFIRREIIKNIILHNGTQLYTMWRHPTIPIHLQFYVFDLTNPYEASLGARPSFTQKGPYTYREIVHKIEIEPNNNDTVTYRQVKTYEFERELSVGPDTDTFTTVNIPVMVVSDWVRNQPEVVQKASSMLLRLFKEDLFYTISIKKIVWGYQDPMLRLAKKFLPGWFYTDTVGFLAGKNDTDDGVYTVFTGERDITRLGYIDKYNGSKYLTFWSTSYANEVNGTDGSIHPPFMTKDTTLQMFQSIICRSGTAVFESTTLSRHDIELYRFVAPSSSFASAKDNPNNAGFCTPYGHCMGSGVLNVSSCQLVDHFHIPVVLSFPHFYMADQKYVDAVQGLRPDSSLATHLDIEPLTGLVMHGERKIQINVYVENSSSFSQLQHVNTMVFPVLWMNESVAIDQENAERFKRQVALPVYLTRVFQIAFISIGSVVTLISAGCLVWLRHSTNKQLKCLTNGDGIPTATERTPLLQPDAHLVQNNSTTSNTPSIYEAN
ncbi:Lysosome membrane protein 2 [Lamellibrachia satsuma]|nr:Lysosome membrane protein 2 [Lamellibrachia satsuma]